MRKRLILAAVALLCPFTWAAPALAQACYSGSYSYGYTTSPAYSTTGSYTYAAPTVGSRLAYRAFHPLAGLRGRFAARRALRGSWVAGGACYSDGYGGGACYSAAYGGGYGSYYAAPVPYQPVAPTACPPGYHWGGYTQSCVPNMQPRPVPMPSPQVAPAQPGAGTHPCPCGDAACNHTLGACPCADPQCKCHLPGPTPAPAPSPNVAPHHPGKAVKP